ncbi:MAG: amino acid ABC transporter permease [Candidatus Limnocylindrales bacterium]
MSGLPGPGGPLDSGSSFGLQRGGQAAASRRAADRRELLHSSSIALVSTVVFFGLLSFVIVNAPGWSAVETYFFNARWFAYSWPALLGAFAINVQLFTISEVLILILALVLAVFRSLPGPVFFPLRLLATIYVDLFQAVPGLLIIVLLGFGIPGLGLPGIPTDPFFYGVVALTLVYSAYVSEVYRAGIESIHPSQEAAARSLGLTRIQTLRYVILPQAIRRVIPPLLNDFIGLQKDTVLVSYLGLVEAFQQSYIIQSAKFNSTPYVALALMFVVITIPLARFTDWLIARDRRRFVASAR